MQVMCLLTQPVFSLTIFSFIPALAPLTQAQFGWTPAHNSLLFLGVRPLELEPLPTLSGGDATGTRPPSLLGTGVLIIMPHPLPRRYHSPCASSLAALALQLSLSVCLIPCFSGVPISILHPLVSRHLYQYSSSLVFQVSLSVFLIAVANKYPMVSALTL